MGWLDGIADSMDTSLSKLQEIGTGKPVMCGIELNTFPFPPPGNLPNPGTEPASLVSTDN